MQRPSTADGNLTSTCRWQGEGQQQQQQQVGDKEEEAGVLAAQCRNPVIVIRRGNRRGDSSSRVEGYVAQKTGR